MPDATHRIQRLLAALPELASAQVIAAYAAVGHEVSIAGALASLRQAGRQVWLPRLEGERIELHAVSDERDLAPGRFGLLEPVAGAAPGAIRTVDVFLVPGVLFDEAGTRLGRGRGHYDRLLVDARPDARLLGICYAERRVARLPRDAWDVAMHAVVCEDGVTGAAQGERT